MKACETRIGMNGTKRIVALTTPLAERSAAIVLAGDLGRLILTNHENKGKEQLYRGWQSVAYSKQTNLKNEKDTYEKNTSNRTDPCYNRTE